jgi:hypothetical protein
LLNWVTQKCGEFRMQQLTKPEFIQGELVVNLQLTSQDIRDVHEALLFYLQEKTQNSRESTYQRIKSLREELLKLQRVMNQS